MDSHLDTILEVTEGQMEWGGSGAEETGGWVGDASEVALGGLSSEQPGKDFTDTRSSLGIKRRQITTLALGSQGQPEASLLLVGCKFL